MTADRARAYSSLMRALASAPGELSEEERSLLRAAADELVFCRDAAPGPDARDCLDGATAQVDDLVRSRRWSRVFAGRLLAKLAACGPPASAASTAAGRARGDLDWNLPQPPAARRR
jgi:hypothetical protein